MGILEGIAKGYIGEVKTILRVESNVPKKAILALARGFRRLAEQLDIGNARAEKAQDLLTAELGRVAVKLARLEKIPQMEAELERHLDRIDKLERELGMTTRLEIDAVEERLDKLESKNGEQP